ncbi:MAG: hypothetical protein M0Z67_03160 [Nitrospiraceae bacterium]|nr:hypothetical protein [Nitrospiraceae bacterium]
MKIRNLLGGVMVLSLILLMAMPSAVFTHDARRGRIRRRRLQQRRRSPMAKDSQPYGTT